MNKTQLFVGPSQWPADLNQGLLQPVMKHSSIFTVRIALPWVSMHQEPAEIDIARAVARVI